MKVLVTGGTGFTGARVVPLLVENGYSVRCFVRPTSDRSALPSSEIEWAIGDLADTRALTDALRGEDALVNIASLGFGNADSILRAAHEAGIQRAIFISTTAIFTQLNARSKQARMEAERLIQASRLQYTILRPTMIYGSRRDRNMWRLIQFIRFSPVVPVFGDGDSLQQPIYVDDVAQAVLRCLQSETTIGKCYNLAGKDPLTYNEVIDTIATLMNRRIWKLHIPSIPVVSLLGLFERLRIPFPIKAEQVLRLNENKSFSYEEAQTGFEFRPLSFMEGIAIELRQTGIS